MKYGTHVRKGGTALHRERCLGLGWESGLKAARTCGSLVWSSGDFGGLLVLVLL